ELLGKALAAFEACRQPRWTKDPQAASLEFVHYAQGEGQFRSDDRKVGLEPEGRASQLLIVFQVTGQAGRVRTNAAINGKAEDFADPRRLLQLPHQGMFATTTADNQDSHMRTDQDEAERLGGCDSAVNWLFLQSGAESHLKRLSPMGLDQLWTKVKSI